jgi:hypothetical protein
MRTLRQLMVLGGVLLAGDLQAAPQQVVPGPVPTGMQLPFEPDPALLSRLRQHRCWSEYRLYDPKTQTLGETLALEGLDSKDTTVARLYLRKDGKQLSARRTSLKFTPPGATRAREATGDEGPDSVGTHWTATFVINAKQSGTASMVVQEVMASSGEIVATGTLVLPGILREPITVAHSAGCSISER